MYKLYLNEYGRFDFAFFYNSAVNMEMYYVLGNCGHPNASGNIN